MKDQTAYKILALSCLLSMLICLTTTSAQTRRTTKTQSKESEQMKEAKVAWMPFYTKFRSAISSRDSKVLRKMLSNEFEGDYDENGDGDGIDDTLRIWLSSRDRKAILAAKPSTYSRNDDNNLTRTIDWQIGDPCCVIVFEFRSDGKWYITNFYCGCTA